MTFIALRFEANAEMTEIWGDALLATGAVAVDMADADVDTPRETATYGDPGAAGSPSWQQSRVTALLSESADPAEVVAAVIKAVGQPFPPWSTFAVADQDWVRATQSQFLAIAVGDSLWVVPSWCQPVDPSAINLMLDPGLAFGTGSHPTTRLCLQWLVASIEPGQDVLDYGCGSGILAIGAARLGARTVTGVDLDPQAIQASKDNALRNGVNATFVTPDGLADDDLFDVVVANILANPLIMLAPALARRVAKGGHIVLSGVLRDQAPDVMAGFGVWFRIAVWKEEDGWVVLAGARL